MSYFFSPIIAQCGSQEKEFITWQGEGEKDTNLSKVGSLAVSINTHGSAEQDPGHPHSRFTGNPHA